MSRHPSRPELLAALVAILPYAESRAEDLAEFKAEGLEDPNYPGADAAWAAVRAAQALIDRAKEHPTR